MLRLVAIPSSLFSSSLDHFLSLLLTIPIIVLHLVSGQSFATKCLDPWSTTLLASQLSALKDHGWETGEDRLDHLLRLTEANENCTWNTLRSTKVLLNRQSDLNVPYNIPVNGKNTFETSFGTRASITSQRVHPGARPWKEVLPHYLETLVIKIHTAAERG